MGSDRIQGLSISDRISMPEGADACLPVLHGKTYNILMTPDALSQHVLFSGSIGSGKTTAMYGLLDSIIRSMDSKDVMVVFDAKGDFRKHFFRPGKDAVISCRSDATTIWNMFREVELDGPEELEMNLTELVNSFFDEKIRRSNAPFFPVAARDVLYGIMLYIIRSVDIRYRTNEELYLYLRDASLEDVIGSFEEMDDLRGLLDYIYSESGMTEQSQGVYSELRTVAKEMLIGNFRKSGDFSIRSFVRNKGGRILFVEYDLMVGSVLTPIYKAIFDLAIKESLSRKHSDGNVYFVIDEFSLLPRLYHISDGVNFGRGLGAKFIVAIQNCQQIIEAYGAEGAYSILSSFGTLVSFRTAERATINFIQDHYGSARINYSYAARDSRQGNRETFVTQKAVEDLDILSLQPGEAIVSVAAYSPSPVRFRFQKIF